MEKGSPASVLGGLPTDRELAAKGYFREKPRRVSREEYTDVMGSPVIISVLILIPISARKEIRATATGVLHIL